MDLHKPSNKEITINIEIIAQDKKGKINQLILHTHEDINSAENMFLNYNNHITVGDIVYDEVKKAIKEDFKIENILNMNIFEEKAEEIEGYDLDEDVDYSVVVLVEFKQEYTNKLGELYTSWIVLDLE